MKRFRKGSHVAIAKSALALVAVAALLTNAFGCGDEAPPPAPDPVQPIKILEIAGVGSVGTVDFPGEIRAAQEVALAFEDAGKLIELPVLDGQEVAQGEVLARLDPRDFENVRDAQNAKLASAKADLSRVQALFDADVTSQQELDTALSRYDIARADASRALKALESNAIISAPFAGTVAKVFVKNFQNVNAKETIVLLQDTSSLEVAFAIPEAALAGRRPGRSADERDAQLQPRVTVSSIPGQSFPAKMKEFSPTADPNSRTFQAVVTFERPREITILPGMTASVQVNLSYPGSEGGGSIQIPSMAALADEQGKAYVWKVDPSNMQVSRLKIELGPLSGESVSVTSGLVSGDWIATSGVHQLREGMSVSRHQ